MGSESRARSAGEVDHIEVQIESDESTLGVRHLPAADSLNDLSSPVLYVHGATFPSGLAVGFRFNGYSWMDSLSDTGVDVWGFDFLGYGESDHYPEVSEPPETNPPVGRVPSAVIQLERVVEHICEQQNAETVSLIAHSWGTLVAGRYVAANPGRVNRLALFGPISRRDQTLSELPAVDSLPAYRLITLADQWERFAEDVPDDEPPVLLDRHFEPWGKAYLASDSMSEARTPASVQTPSGPIADIAAAWQGDFAYDPSEIDIPTLIVRGEWDSLVTDEDARWLFDSLVSATPKRDVKISRGTHLLHLEEHRYELYREVECFLTDQDTP